MKIFFVYFCVFMLPLLNIFCFSWVHTISVLYCAHLCMTCSLGISNFLEEISSLSLSIVFLYFFALIAEEGFLILAILWNSAFRCLYISFSPLPLLLFFSQLFVRPPQTNILPFCISFSWGWSWSLPPVQCHEPLSIVLQALYQIWSLESICHFHCIIIRDLN